ncbi:MFS transporter [Paludisphaera borealis]|uniref:MFS transporter n=1 Tax=Paludisphaera borealis TaxID=1387353 RepID=UPI000970A239|nr:MFS transporter [Paludisphaera borealis]
MSQLIEGFAGTTEKTGEQPTRVRFVVLASLCAVSLVTYIDRVGFATGAPYLKKDLGLSDEQMGYLLSTFFWAYGGFQILGGWLGDRLGSRHLLTILVLGWSLTTGALALVVYVPGFQAQLWYLIALRFLFGVFQAGGFPVLSRINADWMPVTTRGMSQGLIWMSSRIGGALIPLALVPMFAAFGTWRTPFWILAGVGVVWCTAFWPWFRDTPEEMPQANAAERKLITAGRAHRAAGAYSVPWSRLFASRSAWCLCLAYGFGGFASNFFVGWLPTYLSDHRHLSDSDTKLLTSLPLAFGVVACISGGVLSDWIIRRTGSRSWGRRINGSIGMAMAAAALGSTVWVESVPLLAFLLCLTFVCNDVAMGPAWAACADIGEQAAGTLGGAMNMMSNIGGAVSALVAGYLFGHGHPSWVFVIFSCCYALASLSWLGVDASKPLTAATE